jgi:hypothetical protein
MTDDLPPALPPPTPVATASPHSGRPLWQRCLIVGVIIIGGLALLTGSVMFVVGEDLFGSDRATIDSYNREVLSSCDLPPGSTLVRSYILGLNDPDGEPLRSLTHVYASQRDAEELVDFYGLEGPGVTARVSRERACKFGQLPVALVLSRWTPEQNTAFDGTTQTKGLPADPDDALWGGGDAEVVDLAAIPDGTRSFLGLRLAQREVEGLFGEKPAISPGATRGQSLAS